MKVLVATDGSEFSLAALRYVANGPWPAGSVAKVISVPEFILFKDPSYPETHEVKELGKASIEDAKLSLAAGVGILSGSELKRLLERAHLCEGWPYRVILNQAKRGKRT